MANPRGFCAGVNRAIDIVERALDKFGAPIYVRHEVVHNKFVVDGLREKGAVFVDELDDVPAFLFGDHFADAHRHAGAGTAVSENPHQLAVGALGLPFLVGEIARGMARHFHALAVFAVAGDAQALAEINLPAFFDALGGGGERTFDFLDFLQLIRRYPRFINAGVEGKNILPGKQSKNHPYQ